MSELKQRESLDDAGCGHVSHGLLLELVNGRHIICFNERTIVAQRATQFGATIRYVVVARAVCRSRELLEEL